MQRCAVCSKEDAEVYRLAKCPVCYKHVCQDCAVRLYGRYFCSQTCAHTFFHIQDQDD